MRQGVRSTVGTIAIIAALLGSAASTSALAAAASSPAPCTSTALRGGEWPAYGHDASNSRAQGAERLIGTGNVAKLVPAWVFDLSSNGGAGNFESTPTVAGGCVFVASNSGTVYALSARSGKPIWHRTFPRVSAGVGGEIVGAVAVDGGHVVVAINQQADGTHGPYLVALDRSNGSVAWSSAPIATTAGYYTNASPQVFAGLVFQGFSPTEGDSGGQGGFVLLDARTGALVRRTPTISPAEQQKGFAGGGIWSTPAYDPATGYAYVGAGNPYSKTEEASTVNAILKVDLNRSRPTFGNIVAAYKGNVDSYTQVLQAVSQLPACAATASLPSPVDDPLCGQLDLDFGAAPNLFAAGGRKVVGDLQKSGVYHVADAARMTPVWAATVGASCQLCNAASTAVAAGRVYGESTPGGVAFALAAASGSPRWVSPVGDGAHYQAVSYANGVAYTLDTAGFFDAFNGGSGLPLVRRPIAIDARAPAGALTSAGVSIAYHEVFVAAGLATPDGYLVAYKLPGT